MQNTLLLRQLYKLLFTLHPKLLCPVLCAYVIVTKRKWFGRFNLYIIWFLLTDRYTLSKGACLGLTVWNMACPHKNRVFRVMYQ